MAYRPGPYCARGMSDMPKHVSRLVRWAKQMGSPTQGPTMHGRLGLTSGRTLTAKHATLDGSVWAIMTTAAESSGGGSTKMTAALLSEE